MSENDWDTISDDPSESDDDRLPDLVVESLILDSGSSYDDISPIEGQEDD